MQGVKGTAMPKDEREERQRASCREYYKRTKETQNQRCRKYYEENKSAIIKRTMDQRKQCKEIYKAKLDQWKSENPDKVKDHHMVFRVKRKIEVLSHYSDGKMACTCCGESELSFLTIDHINNDGADHRKKEPLARTNLYAWIRKNNFPEGFQVLCFNCNMGKSYFGVCPHKLKEGQL